VSPGSGGIIRDTRNNCIGSYSKRADWASNALASLPIRLNSAGEIAGFGMSSDLKSAYDFHAKSAPCNNGITVSIPANAIVGSSDSVAVSMSAIDLFSPDGMPGDYSTRMQQGTGYMESFGAFSIEMYDKDDNEYKLSEKEGHEAEVTFPTDVLLPNREKLPDSVPLLYYDEKQGEWKREGEAILDRKRNLYVAKVKHFSAINLDLEKDDPACVRVADNGSDATNPTYTVEVTIPPTGGGTPRVGTNTIQAADLCTDPGVERQFALTRLPQNTDVSIVFFNAGPIPLATYVVKTGATNAALADRTRPTCVEMPTLCGTSIIDFNTTPVGSQEVLVAGCKRPGTNDIVVSIAVNKAVAPAGLPASAQLRITVFASDTESCGENAADFITLPAPVFVHDTPGGFQVSQYVIPNSELCDTNPPVAIKVAIMNPGLVSNDAIVASTCDF
jgi:hypothetical protein